MKRFDRAVEDVMATPCIVVYSRGQLTMVQAALEDAEERFASQPDDEFPLPWIRSARARTEEAMRGLPDV